MQGGIRVADRVLTVSPNYAGEIQTPEGGHGLHEILRCPPLTKHKSTRLGDVHVFTQQRMEFVRLCVVLIPSPTPLPSTKKHNKPWIGSPWKYAAERSKM
eukprot:574205-Amphidinium_carterae.1